MSTSFLMSKSHNELILMANSALRYMDNLALRSPMAGRATATIGPRPDTAMESTVTPAAAVGVTLVGAVKPADSVSQPGTKRSVMDGIERSTRAKRRRVSVPADDSEPESSGDEGDIPFRKPSTGPTNHTIQLWMKAQYKSKNGCATSKPQPVHSTPESTALSSSQLPAQVPWQSISPTAVEYEIVTRFILKGNEEFYVLRPVGRNDSANFQVSVHDIGDFVSHSALQEYEHRIFRENMERGWTDRDRYQAMKDQYPDHTQNAPFKRVTRAQHKTFLGESKAPADSHGPTAIRSSKETPLSSKSSQAPRRPQQGSRSKGKGNMPTQGTGAARMGPRPKETPGSTNPSVPAQLQEPGGPRISAAKPTPAPSKESCQRSQRIPDMNRGSGIILRFKEKIWNSYSKE